MLSCREVAREIASEGLERRSRLHRFRVRLHLFMCRRCRAYGRQIRALGVLARHLCQESAPDEAHLQKLEATILHEVDARRPQERP